MLFPGKGFDKQKDCNAHQKINAERLFECYFSKKDRFTTITELHGCDSKIYVVTKCKLKLYLNTVEMMYSPFFTEHIWQEMIYCT